MDLWIRSQDKKALIPINKMLTISCSSIFYDGLILGVYKKEQRALEVLNEIQKKINLINLGHDFGSPMVDLENPTYIYEMPKE